MFSTQRRPAAGPAAVGRPARRFPALLLVIGVASLLPGGPARALDDQWYVGVGGGAALLRPDAVDPALDADEAPRPAATLFVGRDLDELTSLQLQLYGLGEAELDGGATVDYRGGDASILYRFFDSRDRAPRGTVFGASLYGRFGLGVMQRDTDVALESDADVNFGAGAGIELYLTRYLALRAEGLFHDRDAGSAQLSLVARFGGVRRLPPPPAAPTPAPVAAPPASIPAPDPAPSTDPRADPLASPDPAALPGTPGLPSGDTGARTTIPDTATTGPGADPSALPDPATLPETLNLPRDGTGVPATAPDTATTDLRAGPSAPPDPATLPETPSLPRDGTTAPGSAASGTADGASADRASAPGAASLPTTPGAPPSAPAGAGTSGRDVPIELPTLPPGTDPVDAATPPPAPSPIPAPTSSPDAATAPAGNGDADGDGVADDADVCPRSAPGFPVRENGCALLDGVLSGLRFVPGTAELETGAEAQLDYLANLLEEYPAARVELLAHTDDAGSVREQSILTRARLRTIGTYLVQQRGIRANRLVLRSFGGTRPLYDNRSEEGREGNNRIEIFENAN